MSGSRQQKQKNVQNGPPNKKTYIDSTTGKKVNDYIPKYISSTPWYYKTDTLDTDSNNRKRKSDDTLYREIKDKSYDRLKHQRLNPFNNTDDSNVEIVKNNEPKKGAGIKDKFIHVNNDIKESDKSTKMSKIRIRDWKRKGLCENCGGKHKKSDCIEKPHRLSYFYRGDNNGTTDNTDNTDNRDNTDNTDNAYLIKENTDNWDIKQDRWYGIDIDNDYKEVLTSLKKKEENVVSKYIENDKDSKDSSENDILIKAILKNNPLAQDPNDPVIQRSLDEKPRYLEVIKTGEELRYNPKSRVYKDLNQGYLNERNQFIPYLTGEAAEFEKMKKFTKSIQHKQRKIWNDDKSGNESFTKKDFASEISPTAAMIKMKEKEEKDEIIKQAKKKQLLEKYGAL